MLAAFIFLTCLTTSFSSSSGRGRERERAELPSSIEHSAVQEPSGYVHERASSGLLSGMSSDEGLVTIRDLRRYCRATGQAEFWLVGFGHIPLGSAFTVYSIQTVNLPTATSYGILWFRFHRHVCGLIGMRYISQRH